VISAEHLRGVGAQVEHALCVIDREEGGTQALAGESIALHALLTRRDLDRAAGQAGTAVG
jgi:orotate phosphoribosyltransferase